MWYVIQVDVNQEGVMRDRVAKVLAEAVPCDLFVPRYFCMWKTAGSWTHRMRALFPGYLFLDFDPGRDEKLKEEVVKRLRILTSRKAEPVCIGGGFYPIRPEEQEFLEEMMGQGHLIDVSVGNSIGGRPVIESGPLKGKEDRISYIDRHRRFARVRCSLWGEERTMKLGLEIVWKDEGAAHPEGKNVSCEEC